MKKSLLISLVLLLNASMLLGGNVSGKITFKGKVPKMKPLKIAADPVCVANNTMPPKKEWLIVDGNGGLKNVLVYVSEGASSTATPSTNVVVDQKGCVYTPHVFGIQTGQSLEILNSDGTLHNIHALPKINREFNKAMPKFKKKMMTQFDKPEAPFKIKCDVHPWMGAFVGVFDHSYFAVSGDDGSFSISGLKPGQYTITAWHEKLKTKSMTVTVGVGSTSADFTFTKPKKK